MRIIRQTTLIGFYPILWNSKALLMLESQIAASWLNTQGFINVQTSNYWSASSFAPEPVYAWPVLFYDGRMSRSSKINNLNVWPVRAGQAGLAKTWRTGQINSFAAGDDGDLQRGVIWPSPRFIDHSDGTVTDQLTGLFWLKNADCFGTRTWSQALVDSNNLASGSCGLSDGSSAGDWRLPNKKELLSLVDYSQYHYALPIGHLFDEPYGSWSSTPNSSFSDIAFFVDMALGFINIQNKQSSIHVWPVRDGFVNEPKLHALIVGINYDEFIHTGAGADAVFSQLKKYDGWAITNPDPIILNVTNVTNNSMIEQTLNDIKLNVTPGDKFIFYFCGHGGFETYAGGDETAILFSLFPPTFWNEHDEFIETSTIANLSDDTLSSWFDDPAWDNVNKLIMLDACHSGGFSGDNNPGDEGDLEKLSKIGLLASCPEAGVSFFNPFTGMGIWTERLLNCLKSNNNIQEIALCIEEEDVSEFFGIVLPLLGDVFPPNGTTLTFDVTHWEPVFVSSDDFSFNLQKSCEGDFIIDHVINEQDLTVFAADFGRNDCSGDCNGDFNDDGDVDGVNFFAFVEAFGRTDCP